MKLKLWSKGLALISFFSLFSYGSESDLTRLYDIAVDVDPEMQIAKQRLARAEALYDGTFGKMLPQISATAQMSGTDYSSTDISYDYLGERYNLSLTQPIFDLSAWSDVERSSWDREQQRANVDFALNDRTAILVERYFAVLKSESDIALAKEELGVTEKNLKRIESLFEKQLVSKIDMLDALSRRDQILAEIAQFEAELGMAREMLAESVGDAAYTPLNPIEFSKDRFELAVQTEDYWLEIARTRSPILLSAEARQKSAEAALARAENERLPKVSLRLSSQYTNIGSEFAQTNYNSANVISLNITAPLYLGGTEFAKIRSEEANLASIRSENDLSRLRVFRELRSAFLSTKALLRSRDAAIAALASTRTAREAAEKEYNFGITDIVSMMERISAEFTAAKRLNDTSYKLLATYINMLRWSGNLNRSDLERLSELLY